MELKGYPSFWTNETSKGRKKDGNPTMTVRKVNTCAGSSLDCLRSDKNKEDS